jgi:hypothetical protein
MNNEHFEHYTRQQEIESHLPCAPHNVLNFVARRMQGNTKMQKRSLVLENLASVDA